MNEISSMWGIIGVIAFAAGIYALWSFVKMRRTGEIDALLLLGKELAQKECRNREEYIKKVKPALLIFGIAAAGFGLTDVIHWYIFSIPAADNAAMMIFFFVLVWFAFYTGKLKSRYF